MSSTEAFSHALQVELSKPNNASAKEAGSVITVFQRFLKNVIAAIGLGDMTKDEFLALVGVAIDTFMATMTMPPMIKSMIKSMLLMIAGSIYDKRHAPKPVANPMI